MMTPVFSVSGFTTTLSVPQSRPKPGTVGLLQGGGVCSPKEKALQGGSVVAFREPRTREQGLSEADRFSVGV
jgi:hypothetical protein